MAYLLPVSAIVPTRNRSATLGRMLNSLAQQSYQPSEMVVMDASSDTATAEVCGSAIPGLETKLVFRKSRQTGAAVQRNEAVEHASHAVLLFLDDDILFESSCILRLWNALQSDEKLGGVNAMITNQKYLPPGRLSRFTFRLLHGSPEVSYAGQCIGPALNLLPEDSDNLPEVVPVEWLNLGCTIYRTRALPSPPFDSHFIGYSLMEDLALSLKVGRKWKLANARTARIYHDSQAAAYKSNQATMAQMELVNRHWVMTQILRRTKVSDYAKLALLEVFGVATPLASLGAWKHLPSVIAGKARGIIEILQQPDHERRDSLLTTSNEGVVPKLTR